MTIFEQKVKKHALKHKAEHIAVVKGSVDSVLRQRQAEREACFSLPYTIAFFAVYTLSLSYHEDTRTVHLAESSVREFLEGYRFDEGRTLHEVVEMKHMWMFMHDALLPAVFQQTDHLGHPLPRADWSRFLGRIQLHGGVLLEQYRVAGAKPTGSPGMGSPFAANSSKLLYFPEEGMVSASELSDSLSDERRLRGASAGKDSEISFAVKNEPKGVLDQDTYPFFLFEQESIEMLQERLKYIEELPWIDDSTRQVAVKMILVNEDIGLFQQVVIRFDFPETGSILTGLSIQSSFRKAYGQSISVFLDIVWFILLMYIFGTELKEVISAAKADELKVYLKDVWNFLDWATVLVGFSIIVLFTIQRRNLGNIEELFAVIKVEQKPTMGYIQDMYNLHNLAEKQSEFSMWFRLILADYMGLIMLRFFKAFKGHPRLAVVTSTIYHAGSDLLHFAVVFASIFLSFAFAGSILFGRRLAAFSTFGKSFGTCFAILCGEFTWDVLSAEHMLTAMMWFWAFMILVFLIMLNMVLAIVMDVYTKVRSDSEQGDPVWVQAADFTSALYKRAKSISQKHDRKSLEVDIHELIDVVGEMNVQRVTVSKLRAAVPELSLEQASRVLKDAESWQTMQEEKGMHISDAIKLIRKINGKVNELTFLFEEGQNNKLDKGTVMLARKAVRWRVKRVIFTAYFSGELEKMCETIQTDRMQEKLRQMEMDRKIGSAECKLEQMAKEALEGELKGRRRGSTLPIREGRRTSNEINRRPSEDESRHKMAQKYSTSPPGKSMNGHEIPQMGGHKPAGNNIQNALAIDGGTAVANDHLASEVQELKQTLSDVCAGLKNVASLEASLREITTAQGTVLSEVSASLRSLRAAPPTPESPNSDHKPYSTVAATSPQAPNSQASTQSSANQRQATSFHSDPSPQPHSAQYSAEHLTSPQLNPAKFKSSPGALVDDQQKSRHKSRSESPSRNESQRRPRESPPGTSAVTNGATLPNTQISNAVSQGARWDSTVPSRKQPVMSSPDDDPGLPRLPPPQSVKSASLPQMVHPICSVDENSPRPVGSERVDPSRLRLARSSTLTCDRWGVPLRHPHAISDGFAIPQMAESQVQPLSSPYHASQQMYSQQQYSQVKHVPPKEDPPPVTPNKRPASSGRGRETHRSWEMMEGNNTQWQHRMKFNSDNACVSSWVSDEFRMIQTVNQTLLKR